jgi:hypothetical protein
MMIFSGRSVLPVMIILDKFTTLAGYFGTGATILPDLPDRRPLHGGLFPLILQLESSTISSSTKYAFELIQVKLN